ncbi:fungal-trans domain-containing protein [Favolaschia claudopus]|uniref:Fungal-trans domain-containing protein n=1 Tax=Favolaschia claudopus TaxID=2862362 RepID=A0AAW0AFY0_9AGAR
MASKDNPEKKRRIPGACDICRATMPDGRCSNCKRWARGSCWYIIRNLNPSSMASSNDSNQTPENARDLVDSLLRDTYTLPHDRESLVRLLFDLSRYARNLEVKLDESGQSQSSPSDRESIPAAPVEAATDDEDSREAVVVDIQRLPERLRRITMYGADNRFFGKNSSIVFLKAAMTPPGCPTTDESCPSLTRPVYWTPTPWEVPPEPRIDLEFPPDDLLHDLIDIYFQQVNIYWPILHRPTFEKSLADRLHLQNPSFGAVVLAVCAVASRNSADERVFLPCEHGKLSAGWKWFRQIPRPFSGQTVKSASLYELQLCCLYITFLHTSGQYESCWIVCGVGILQAQDIGALRSRSPEVPLTIEAELIKRSCFYLSIFDSVSSACFGRPRVLMPNDADLPIICDDEYLGHPDPELAFKQPSGKPAQGEFFNAYISLYKIFTFAWRTSGPPQDYTGTRVLESETLAELDSRLDQWARNIPEHLLWNPYQENDIFFAQSATLYAAFYYVQVLIHRPFLQAKSTSLFPPAIATLLCVKSRRSAFMPTYYFIKAAFDCAIVLLLTVSGASKTGLAVDVNRELEDVYKFMDFLRRAEPRYQNAGRLYDCLCEVLNASRLPLPQPSYDTIRPLPPSEGTQWPSLPVAVEDLGNRPIYESLGINMQEMSVDAGGLPEYNFKNMPPLSTEMDTDHYLLYWLPYLSTVDGVTQAMQSQGASGSGSLDS